MFLVTSLCVAIRSGFNPTRLDPFPALKSRAAGAGESCASASVIHTATKGMMKPTCNIQSQVGEQRHAVGT